MRRRDFIKVCCWFGRCVAARDTRPTNPPSVSCMKQIELKEIRISKDETKLAAHLFQRCARGMRLIGREPDPMEAKTDLLTYCCPPCDEYFVLPIESGANT
jgi:hypothetical protein